MVRKQGDKDRRNDCQNPRRRRVRRAGECLETEFGKGRTPLFMAPFVPAVSRYEDELSEIAKIALLGCRCIGVNEFFSALFKRRKEMEKEYRFVMESFKSNRKEAQTQRNGLNFNKKSANGSGGRGKKS